MGNIADFVISENGVLEQYKGSDIIVEIPDGVREIKWCAFHSARATLKEVIIPETVEVIGNRVFAHCPNLEKVTILGAGLKEIGCYCFEQSSNLKEINFPESLANILDGHTFDGCTALFRKDGKYTYAGAGNEILVHYEYEENEYDFEIPEGVRFVLRGVFKKVDTWYRGNEANFETVHIPESVVFIGDNVFECLHKLTDITLPKNLKTLGSGNFSFCDRLKKVDLGGITKVEEGMFLCDRKLTQIIWSDEITEIGNNLFTGCSDLKNITLPANLKILGTETDYKQGTFEECGITEIIIPEGVTEITSETFKKCKDLKKVTLPSSLKRIGKNAFCGCIALKEINIPDALEVIEENAFCHCSSLPRLVLPGLLQDKADEDFWAMIGFGDENGCVVKDGVLVKYVGNTKHVIISEGVAEIPENTIRTKDGSYIEKVTLPQSLKKLEEQNYLSYHSGSNWMNLPEGYLRTTEKLPVKYTLQLLEKCWSKAATLEDFAALYLFQSGKDLVKHCEKFLVAKKQNAADAFVKVLTQGCKPANIVKAAEFCLLYNKELSLDTLKALYTLAVAKKAKKAVELLDTCGDFASEEQKVEAEKTSAKAKTKKASAKDSEAKAIDEPEEIVAFRGIFHEALLDKTLKKYKGKNDSFASVKLKNGGAAPAYLVKCAVVPYLDIYQGRPKHIGGYERDVIEVKLLPDADRAGVLLDVISLRTALKALYEVGGSAWLLPLCRYADGAQITSLISDMKKWESWYTYGSTGRSDIIIARGAMLLSETREAMMALDKAGCLAKYAHLRETDEDTIRDTRLTDFGLNEKGEKTYDLGGKEVVVTLMQNLTFEVMDTKTGKKTKSLPKKDADAEKLAVATADLNEMKKLLKKVVTARNERLFDEFLSGKTKKSEVWVESYLKNAVLRMVARLIVWKQGEETFILNENGAIDCSENPYTIKNGTPIAVAHPIEMKEEEVKAWQQYFCKYGLKQPFEQIWEPAVKPENIQENRYDGCQISVFRFMNQGKHGISFFDEDFHNEIGFELNDCDLFYERTTWHRHEIAKDETFTLSSFHFQKYTRRVNHIVYLLDKWTVEERIAKDDVSVESLLGSFTLAQIMQYITLAQEKNAVNCTALLMNYKNANFEDFDPMSEFTLD